MIMRALKAWVFGAAFAAVLAMPQAPSGAGGPYEFPSEAETILSEVPIQKTFSCDNQEYGYYADVDNNCEIFHICLPIENNEGEITEYAQWSFVCGNGTIFDQQTLTCNYESDAFPCEEAASLYGTIEYGRLEEKKRL